MNNISYEERAAIYDQALECFGKNNQLVVALEELSECQKEICKAMRMHPDFEHLAEEIADATIMLEQVRLMFDINELVCKEMDRKVTRLKNRIFCIMEAP